MLDESTVEFLHTGCALLIGTADAAGCPHAGRGLGLTVIGDDPLRVRLLVDAADAISLQNLQPNARVAVTAASVPTLRSLQMKGRVVLMEPTDSVDEAKRVQYATDFTNDIHKTDGDPLEVIRRWADHPAVACIIDVETTFDQTPGPSAGTQMGGAGQ